MLEEELCERLARNDEENKLMKYHHDMTRQLEYKHMQVKVKNHFIQKSFKNRVKNRLYM